MASLKDTEQLADSLERLVDQLRSELSNGTVDFDKLVGVADELSEEADHLAETFSSVNETLMQRLQEAKSGSGSRSRSSNRASGSSSESKTSARS